MLSRRQFLIDGSTIVLGTTLPWSCHGITESGTYDRQCSSLDRKPSLRSVASGAGVTVGIGASYRELTEPSIGERVAGEVTLLTAACFYTSSIRPALDSFDFRRADAMTAFAQLHKLRVRGHALIWHDLVPDWLVRFRGDTERLLMRHVETIVQRYSGKCDEWDVVNEPLLGNPESSRGENLRRSIWSRRLGSAYIEIALNAARAVDPAAALGINEYGLEAASPGAARKRESMLALLSRLRNSGVVIHYLGLQAHLVAGQEIPCAELKNFVAAVKALGLRVVVTELDVSDHLVEGGIEHRDRVVADTYSTFLDCAINECSISSIAVWGFSDRNSWLQTKLRRADGAPLRPLLFDTRSCRKPAWAAVAANLRKRQALR